MLTLLVYWGMLCGYILKPIYFLHERRKKTVVSQNKKSNIVTRSAKAFFWELVYIGKKLHIPLNDIYIFIRDKRRLLRRKINKVLLYEYVYIWFRVVSIYANGKSRIKKVPLEMVKDYCRKYGEEYIVIEKETDRVVCIPKCYEVNDQVIEHYVSPEIYIAELENMYITSDSSIIKSSKDEVLYDPMVGDNRTDVRFSNVVGRINNNLIIEEQKNIINIEEGIFLMGFASYNYYHLTIEILSRLDYADRYDQYRHLPIIVDKIMVKIPQYKELVDKINKYNHKVIVLEEGICAKVGKLIYPSYNTWMPINVKKRETISPKDFIIAKSALDNIRSNINFKDEAHDKKIFLSRKNLSATRLGNEAAVRDIFVKYGFEVVYTEKMSYEEQINLFHSAGCVVATSGAALTNIIYCQEGTDVVCIIPEEYKFYGYSTIAYMLGLNPVFLNAKVTERTAYTSSDIFELDLDYCERFLKTKQLNGHTKIDN